MSQSPQYCIFFQFKTAKSWEPTAYWYSYSKVGKPVPSGPNGIVAPI